VDAWGAPGNCLADGITQGMPDQQEGGHQSPAVVKTAKRHTADVMEAIPRYLLRLQFAAKYLGEAE
jgi:hypothetical protein